MWPLLPLGHPDFLGTLPVQGDRVKPLWEDRPYSLVNLYVMLQFNADEFFHTSQLLGQFRSACSVSAYTDQDRVMEDEEFRAGIKEHLSQLKTNCQNLGLTLTRMHLERMSSEIAGKQCTYAELTKMIDELTSRFKDELSTIPFAYIPKEKVRYYAEPRTMFGNDVLDKFSSIITEIEEAGKCYACGRDTACVFHLIRIIEAGLKVIGKSLTIQMDTNRSWDANLKRITAASQQHHSTGELAVFYTGTTARLYGIKDSWRNPTMHIERRYTSEEALDIFNNTVGFMRHLATKLQE